MRVRLLKRALLLVLSVWPLPAGAGGFSSTDRSVVAMGQGGAAAAPTADPGASAYNPAAGAFARGVAASAGLVVAVPALVAEGASWRAEGAGEAALPPHVHLRWTGRALFAGASLTVPFGSQIIWPADGPERFQLIEARLRVLRTAAFVGYRMGDVAVAAGGFLDLGSLALTRALDFIAAEGRSTLDTRATGGGVLVGLSYRPGEVLALGLGYQSRSRLSLSGYADFSVPPELSGRAFDQRVRAPLTMPDRLTLGARYRPLEELALAADLELVLWGTIEALTLDFESAETSDVVQPRDWSATLSPRIGAELRLDEAPWLALRAGVFLDPSPVPASTAGPSSPDSTRVGLSAGAGVALLAGLTLDVAYQLALFTGVESQGAVRYSGALHQVGFALAWRSGE